MLGHSDARFRACAHCLRAHTLRVVRQCDSITVFAAWPWHRASALTGGDDEMRCGQGRCPAILIVCSESYLVIGGWLMFNVGVMHRACIACIKVLTGGRHALVFDGGCSVGD